MDTIKVGNKIKAISPYIDTEWWIQEIATDGAIRGFWRYRNRNNNNWSKNQAYFGSILNLSRYCQEWYIFFEEDTPAAIAIEKPCKLDTCRRMVYSDAKSCWWCGTPV